MTNGRNGAAAKVMDFAGLDKKVRPGILGNIGLAGVPTSISVTRHSICSDPISVNPISPSPRSTFSFLQPSEAQRQREGGEAGTGRQSRASLSEEHTTAMKLALNYLEPDLAAGTYEYAMIRRLL